MKSVFNRNLYRLNAYVGLQKHRTPESSMSTAPPLDPNKKINTLQRAVLSVGAATAAILNPARHDMVATLGETTGHRALQNILKSMESDPEGKLVLRDKPRIHSNTLDLATLRNLPDNTFGFQYTKFLEDNKVTPDSRLSVKFIEDPELQYVMQRYREVHDLFHTVLGMPTNMLGEVAVKWVEALQTGLPMCAGAAVFGPLRFRPKQRERYIRFYLPWALQVGQQAKPLMNVYYEKRWEQPVEEMRKEFNIIPFSQH